MDFIFMLTRDDKTVDNGMEVLEMIEGIGIRHIGFKDLGVERETLFSLAHRIKDIGGTSYMEVVSTSLQSIRNSISTAVELGVDCVLGGTDIAFAGQVLNGSMAKYFPFAGTPVGHPTKLEGHALDISADCRRFRQAGCAGVDLLAYRATQDDPLELVKAARGALDGGRLIVAGGIDSPDRIRALADAGADAFTVGTAIFDGAFSKSAHSVVQQCKEVLRACGE